MFTFGPDIIIWLPIFIYSVILHEVSHGWMAYRMGDPTAAAKGRLTLNPVAHIDPFHTLLMPIMIYVMSGGRFIFGGAKPVPVNPYLARNPRKFMAITSIAGPVTNIAIAAACAMLTRLVMAVGVGGALSTILFYGFLKAGFWNVLLASFNLLPIPPLDGSRVLAYLLPWQLAKAFDKIERFGLLIVMVFVFLPPFRDVTMPVVWKMMITIAWLVGLPIEFLME